MKVNYVIIDNEGSQFWFHELTYNQLRSMPHRDPKKISNKLKSYSAYKIVESDGKVIKNRGSYEGSIS